MELYSEVDILRSVLREDFIMFCVFSFAVFFGSCFYAGVNKEIKKYKDFDRGLSNLNPLTCIVAVLFFGVFLCYCIGWVGIIIKIIIDLW